MKLNDAEIRSALLNPRKRNQIKELMITEGDDQLMDAIFSGYTTASAIAVRVGAPMQSVSARLARLYLKGYLYRSEQKQQSGGYEWSYHNRFQRKVRALKLQKILILEREDVET